MTVSNLPKSVKRITFLQAPAAQPAGGSGELAVRDVLSRSRKKKKMSRGLRAFEKWARRLGRAMSSGSAEYISRHDRSNRKKRDGWLRDYVFNMARANREGMKKLRIPVFKL